MEEIVELVENCKLVKTVERCINPDDDSCDCWGVYYPKSYTTDKYVTINGKEERCPEGWYVIHDGEKVLEIVSEFLFNLRKEKKEHFEKTGFDTPKEYEAYLKGKNESKQQ